MREDRKPKNERTTTTRQQRVALSLVEQMEPGQTLVLHFDGVNLREMVSGKKIRPQSHRSTP